MEFSLFFCVRVVFVRVCVCKGEFVRTCFVTGIVDLWMSSCSLAIQWNFIGDLIFVQQLFPVPSYCFVLLYGFYFQLWLLFCILMLCALFTYRFLLLLINGKGGKGILWSEINETQILCLKIDAILSYSGHPTWL